MITAVYQFPTFLVIVEDRHDGYRTTVYRLASQDNAAGEPLHKLFHRSDLRHREPWLPETEADIEAALAQARAEWRIF